MMPKGAVCKIAEGVQRVYPLAYWGIFSSSETDALRKCPNKLWLFQKPVGVAAVKLSAAFSTSPDDY